jgi:DNA-binding response OmpR family regulator
MPQILIFAFDDWLANQLRQAAADHRWMIKETRRLDAFRNAFAELRHRVIVIQLERTDAAEIYSAIVELRRTQPDNPIIVVSDTKVPDDEKAEWGARWFDLGARFVMFPPLTRATLEDAIVGLMGKGQVS